MPDFYDVLTIAAVVDELNATIGSGRIQRIGLLDPRTIGAEIYAGGQRHYLIASADDRGPRLRLASAMPSLDTALVTPFGLLLRKHVRDGVLLSIDQPPLERLIRFSIAKRLPPRISDATTLDLADFQAEDDSLGEAGEAKDAESREDTPQRHVTLYVELMGRHSNLILVDDAGLIMESAKRVTPAMSRVRQILPRLPYLPPPPPDRLDPRFTNPAEATAMLTDADPSDLLARVIVRAYRGISPIMAREILYRIGVRIDATIGESGPDIAAALVGAISEIVTPLQTTIWSPHIYRQRGDAQPGAVAAFAPVSMGHLAAAYDEVVIEGVSAGLAQAEQAVPDAREGRIRHVQRRQRLLDAVGSAREKAERRLAALAGESARAAEAEQHRRKGELLYAYLWQIEPGQRELTAEGETVTLDPTLSPSENAQSYFERYRKAQSAEAQLPGLAEESRAEIAYLDQLGTLIAQAPGFAELEALAGEWAALTAPAADTRPKRTRAPRRPRSLVDRSGNIVHIGHSGPQNDLVTFEIAGPDDTWLHARGVGGSHVVIRWRAPGAQEDQETIAAAAALAGWYSAARESGGVEVDIARRRHVRKLKGGGPGMVTYRNERTIRVAPVPEHELRAVLTER